MATMNIKDPRVHQLAHELAALKGSSATRAVREALERELERERQSHEPDWAGLRRLQERVSGTSHLWLTDDDIYDEHGLPR
ncbi:MAG TPA: type II toxin-antitoxin system VapB family antitoxin [Beutenbergiaceae bacterium]|nr:type II toxin-antitoxin system VapB family antitoxin [Beutenbergiaceae bacterium]